MARTSSLSHLVGAILHDTYRLERLLGQGAYGAVFAAAHERLRRNVAVKVLFSQIDAARLALLRHEAETTSELGHPNIIEVIDFNTTTDGAPYLVMELLQGRDLGALLREKRTIEVFEAASMLRQISFALKAAHRRGIIHRDLKPQNIFLAQKGRKVVLKLLDFGIAKATAPCLTDVAALSYSAPEQTAGREDEISPRTDVYSVGAILYQMLAGQPPFQAEDSPSMLRMIAQQPPRRLRDLRPDVPELVARAVDKALRKRPIERHITVSALCRAFTSGLMDGGEEDDQEPTRLWTSEAVASVVGEIDSATSRGRDTALTGIDTETTTSPDTEATTGIDSDTEATTGVDRDTEATDTEATDTEATTGIGRDTAADTDLGAASLCFADTETDDLAAGAPPRPDMVVVAARDEPEIENGLASEIDRDLASALGLAPSRTDADELTALQTDPETDPETDKSSVRAPVSLPPVEVRTAASSVVSSSGLDPLLTEIAREPPRDSGWGIKAVIITALIVIGSLIGAAIGLYHRDQSPPAAAHENRATSPSKVRPADAAVSRPSRR